MTLRRAENSGASEETWKVRPRPRRARSATSWAVMSSSAKRIEPESGLIVPAIWLMSVDLPAPFGPIRAWISPGRRSMLTWSVASSAPKLFTRSEMTSTGSAMALPPRQQADDAAAREQYDAEQGEPQEELPALGDAAQPELQHDEDHRAHDRTEQTPDAAEDDEHDELARHLPGQHGGADEAVEVREERTGEPGDHAGDDEGGEADAIGPDADRGDAHLVLSARLQCGAETRVLQHQEEGERGSKHAVAEQEEGKRPQRVDARKAVAQRDRKAVLATIGRPGDGEIVDHLREGERDHDEVDAGRAQADRADGKRSQPARRHRDQPDDEHLLGAGQAEDDRLHRQGMLGQDAGRIAAYAEEGGVAEGDEAAEPKRDVETDRAERKNRDAGGQRHVELLAGVARRHRHHEE